MFCLVIYLNYTLLLHCIVLLQITTITEYLVFPFIFQVFLVHPVVFILFLLIVMVILRHLVIRVVEVKQIESVK